MDDDLKTFCDDRGWAAPRKLSAAQIQRATKLGLVIDPATRTNADWLAKEDADLLCAAVDGISTYDLALRHRRTMQSVSRRLMTLRRRTEPQVAA